MQLHASTGPLVTVLYHSENWCQLGEQIDTIVAWLKYLHLLLMMMTANGRQVATRGHFLTALLVTV